MINKILFIFIAIIYIGCNEEPASSNEGQSSNSNSTLGDSNISGHDVVGSIDDYFYDFDEGYTPYVNSKFNRYVGTTLLYPSTLGDSDTLNFSSVTDYVLSFNIQDGEYNPWDDFVDINENGVWDEGIDDLVEYGLTDEMIQLKIFDETDDGDCSIGACSDGLSETFKDCCLNNPYFECNGEGEYATLDDCILDDSNECDPTLCIKSAGSSGPIYKVEYDDDLNMWVSECNQSPSEWTPNEFDLNQNGLYEYNEWVDLNGNGDIWDDCPDLNYDQQLTQGKHEDIYRQEEIKFSHVYADVLKLEWDNDNDRYVVVSFPGVCNSLLEYKEYLGNSEDAGNPGLYPNIELNDPTNSQITAQHCECIKGTWSWNGESESSDSDDALGFCRLDEATCSLFNGIFTDPDCDGFGGCVLPAVVHENSYDSTTYITQINTDDITGFFNYSDCGSDSDCDSVDEDGTQGNGQWDEGEITGEGESYQVGDGGYGQFYFDQTELVRSDSIYTSEVITFEHSFTYPRKLVSTDSLMYNVSTDCNDNGTWDSFEAFNDSDPNGICDGNEEFTDALNGVYDYGEEFTDAIENGVYDLGEDFVDGNGTRDEDEPFIDTGNGIWDEGEIWIDINGEYDEGEEFVDIGNGEYDDGEIFIDTGNGLYDGAESFIDADQDGEWDEDEEFVDANGNGTWDDAEAFIDSGSNGQWDEGEEFTDATNGVWDFYLDVDGDGRCEPSDQEEFIDSNEDGIWNEDEEFTDSNGNGQWDEGDLCEEFSDTLNGTWDEGEPWDDTNGIYDQGEEFTDVNGNGIRDAYCNIEELSWDSNFNTESSCETAGDSWQTEQFSDILNGFWDEGEVFVDGNGVYNPPEDYVDENQNGVYDLGEECTDLNHNNQWDDGEEFTDDNGNGEWDEGEEFVDENGVWDFYLDIDGDGSCEPEDGDDCEDFVDAGNENGIYDEGEGFVDMNENGVWDNYCMNMDDEEWNDDYLTQNSCTDAGYDWISEQFIDGNGVWDEDEDFVDAFNGVWDEDESLEDLEDGIWNEGEVWVDINGEYDLGEAFIDTGSNGVYDIEEDFTDSNGNGQWDEDEEFVDANENGQWDAAEDFTDALNGTWDFYLDVDEDGKCDLDSDDECEEFVDGNGIWDEGEEFVDALNEVYDGPEIYIDENGNGQWDWDDDDGDGECDENFEECEFFLDANNNGVWDDGEDFVDELNGVWDFYLDVDGDGRCEPDDAESFEDDNDNGEYDYGEPFTDQNSDGLWNSGDDCEELIDTMNGIYDIDEEFIDGNGVWDEGEDFVDAFNGVWDNGEEFQDTLNGTWNEGEDFVDTDGNRKWDEGEEFIDGNKTWDDGEEFTDALNGIWDLYVDVDGNGKCDVTEPFVDANGNGTWDCVLDLDEDDVCAPDELNSCESFTDTNGNGVWDEYDDECEELFDTLNGVWDLYVDVDGDGRCELDDHEAFTDTNGNEEYDDNEPFTDENNNGVWDSGDECEFLVDTMNGTYDEDEDFDDVNGSGVRDSYCQDIYEDSCGSYVTQKECEDEGHSWVLEDFTDGNGYWDEGEDFVDAFNGVWDEGEDFVDELNGVWDFYVDIDGNGRCDLEDGDQCENHIDELDGIWNLDVDIDGDGRCELEEGDRCEELVDNMNGIWDFYLDVNGNGKCEEDDPESFIDINSNGVYDSTPIPEPFTDENGNGRWDAGDGCEVWIDEINGVYDSPEPFLDENLDGLWNSGEEYTDLNNNNIWDGGEEFTDTKNEIYDTPEPFIDCDTESQENNPDDIDDWICENDNDWDDSEHTGNGEYDYGEEFTDVNENGARDGETFTDLLNGVWDEGEEFTDGNGYWNGGEVFADALNDYWDEGEEFTDALNGYWDEGEELTDILNGVWDEGEEFTDEKNGIYDEGEEFTDALDGLWNEGEEFTDGNGIYDEGEEFTDGNGIWDAAEPFTDLNEDEEWNNGEPFTDINENGQWDAAEEFTDEENGEWDFYVDMDGDGRCEPEEGDQCEEFTDTFNGIWDDDEDLVDINGNEIHDYYCSQSGLAWDSNLDNIWSCSNAGYTWIVEDFVDGDGVYSEGEEFEDGNGVWDEGEEFIDALNEIYDGPEYFDDINDSGTLDFVCMCGVNWNSIFPDEYNCELNSCSWEQETYADENSNGQWDEGEEYIDSGGDGMWNEGEDFTDTGNGIPDLAEPFIDTPNGEWDPGEVLYDMNQNSIWDSYCANDTDGVWNEELLTQEYCEFYVGYEWIQEDFEDEGNNIYDIGEEFTDLNGNSQWDDADFIDIGDGEYNEGEPFIDTGDGQYSEGELFVDTGDGEYSEGEPFIDIGDGVWNDAEPLTEDLNENGEWDFVTDINEDGICTLEDGDVCDEFIDLNENGQWDDAEEFTDSAENGIWDEGEDFTDATNGIWDFYIDINGDGMCEPEDGDECEAFTDTGNGKWNQGEDFMDEGNGIWDPAEPFFNYNGNTSDNTYTTGSSYLDRNCNDSWDRAEYRSDDEEPFAESDCIDINGVWISVPTDGYSFCDLGNGQWDAPEGFTDSETGEYIHSPSPYIHQFDEDDHLFEVSNKAETLIASYDVDGSWIAYEVLDDGITITPRFLETEDPIKIIDTFSETITKTKEVSKVDSIVSIYSYNLVENMMTDYIEDYNIAKTVWYENDDRQTNYHLYRKDEDSQDIIQLTHKSYFVLPNGNASEIPGADYENYLLFDEYPSEETVFYTHGGMLRDGEHHEKSSTIYSPETFAEYDVYETYDVSYEPAEMTYGNGVYDYGEDFTDEENGVYDPGEGYSDFNNNGVRDSYCQKEGAWNTYITSELNIGNYTTQGSCEAASYSWVTEPFVDGNGIWDVGEEFVDSPVYIQNTFKITRTKKTMMIGPGLEITEENNTWLSKGKGIVKDEVSFKFNDLIIDGEVVGGDDYDGFYRLEVQNCRHCEEAQMYRASNGMFDERTEVNFNQLNTTGDDFNDDYKKVRTYGIQQISTSSNISE